MKTFINYLKLSLLTIALFFVTACADNDAEEAGEQIDELVDDAGDAFEDAGDEVDDALTDAGNAVEDACEDVKEGANAKDTDC